MSCLEGRGERTIRIGQPRRALEGLVPRTHPMKSVLFVLFLLYVITFCLVRITNPQWFTSPEGPVGFGSQVLFTALVLPFVAVFYFGPAFLLALVVFRFLKRPITLPGAGALFVAGALTSCTFIGHPLPVVFGFFVAGLRPMMIIIPIVSTGAFVVLVFGWLSHRGRRERRNGSE